MKVYDKIKDIMIEYQMNFKKIPNHLEITDISFNKLKEELSEQMNDKKILKAKSITLNFDCVDEPIEVISYKKHN